MPQLLELPLLKGVSDALLDGLHELPGVERPPRCSIPAQGVGVVGHLGVALGVEVVAKLSRPRYAIDASDVRVLRSPVALLLNRRARRLSWRPAFGEGHRDPAIDLAAFVERPAVHADESHGGIVVRALIPSALARGDREAVAREQRIQLLVPPLDEPDLQVLCLPAADLKDVWITSMTWI